MPSARPKADALGSLPALLDKLARDGVIRHGVAQGPLPFERLWQAMEPLATGFNLLPTLQEISVQGGLSLRYVARDIDALRSALGMVEGWRETTRRHRIRLAVVSLSVHDATIREVAEAVGYGSVDAMSRAFRDAELPAPSFVRHELLRAEARRSGADDQQQPLDCGRRLNE